ncbi:SAM-dependent methyltransferase [Hamadaea flava]|uniref:Methyltransferase n=1 Tax=Hamadaea flava TaxID=1742688 RepID=A0ABV8LLR4_9ACTN|nr:DNA methyltransferase [Hamadaea flava]MCP2323666.1 SAM-dependent methyltransferase [Hamadaea flava]
MSVPTPQLPLSVWLTAQKTSRWQRHGRYLPASVRHPARMLPAIAAHAIAAYTQPGELVLDPMCGIGTTLVEATHLGRDAIGVEYEPAWAELATRNIAHAAGQGATGTAVVHTGDATTLTSLVPPAAVGKVALVLTSPPYGPATHGQVRPEHGHGIAKTHHAYGDPHDRVNLAHAGRDLIDGFTQILSECATVLRPGGIVAVTARPFRRNGTLIDLPSQVLQAGIAAGLQPVERCVALLAAVRSGRLISRASFFQTHLVRKARAAGTPMQLLVHEDVIVLSALTSNNAADSAAVPQLRGRR